MFIKLLSGMDYRITITSYVTIEGEFGLLGNLWYQHMVLFIQERLSSTMNVAFCKKNSVLAYTGSDFKLRATIPDVKNKFSRFFTLLNAFIH